MTVRGWTDNSGRTRVYFSLRGLSQAGWVVWFDKWEDSPAQRATAMLMLHRSRARLMARVKMLLTPTDGSDTNAAA